jgi:hypothetical protein
VTTEGLLLITAQKFEIFLPKYRQLDWYASLDNKPHMVLSYRSHHDSGSIGQLIDRYINQLINVASDEFCFLAFKPENFFPSLRYLFERSCESYK